jgi:hypothetical protein
VRPTLALALVLLALTLALENGAVLFPRRAAPALAGSALEIIAASKGPLLPAGTLPGGDERIADAICIGERTLVGDGRDGLRAAFVGPGAVVQAHTTFELAHSAADARALARALADAAPGTLVVLASSGGIRATGPEADGIRAELARALAELGARAVPGSAERESWAYIGLRRAREWVPLAEGYSRDSGVVLAFLLAQDPAEYDGFQGDRVHVRAGRERLVELAHELRHAEHTGGAEVARERTVQGRSLPGLALPAPGRIAWRDVELGPGSGLLVWVGLDDAASAGADGARLEVRIDGESVASHVALPGAPWRVLQVDLRPFAGGADAAGRRVTLELVATPGAAGAGGVVLLGHPLLVHGYDRSPLEVWTEQR